jgi:hypothetical protein
MRLEGRNRGPTASTAQKSVSDKRITRAQPEMYGRLHLPARLVPRPCDVASASELSVENALPLRSVTMSSSIAVHLLFLKPMVSCVRCGVR